jgi:glycosyltransferase involved in cell wall biosynthesis
MSEMKPVPKVSVALPVYNGEKDFEGALLSILNQDFCDLDIIICDNGSIDSTPDIYKKYAAQDQRIRVSVEDTSSKKCRGFNRGFYLSQSPYFMWAASDDRRDPTFITKCLQVLEQDESIALVYPHTRMVDDHGNIITVHHDPFDLTSPNPSDRYKQIAGNLGWCNCFYGLYRRSLLAKTQVWDHAVAGVDALMITNLLFHGKIVQLPEQLFYRNMQQKIAEPEKRMINSKRVNESWFYPAGTGITCSYIDYIWQHFEIVQFAPIPPQDKPALLQLTKERFTTESHLNNIRPELDRLIQLVLQNRFYEEWDPQRWQVTPSAHWEQFAKPLYLTKLLQLIERCLFLIPNYPGLQSARGVCLVYLGRIEEAKTCIGIDVANYPNLKYASDLLSQLQQKFPNT